MDKEIDEIKKDMAELTDLLTKDSELLTAKINTASLDLNNRIDSLSKEIDGIKKNMLNMLDVIKRIKRK